LHGLGVGLMEKGKLDKAADLFRQALAITPGMAKAWLMLTQVKRQKERDAELAGMEAQHAKAPADSLARMQLSFGLGKANDDLKDYNRAFDYFAEATPSAARASIMTPSGTRRIRGDEDGFRRRLFRKAQAEPDFRRHADLRRRHAAFGHHAGRADHRQATAKSMARAKLSILKTAVGKQFPTNMPGGFPWGLVDVPDAEFAEAAKPISTCCMPAIPTSGMSPTRCPATSCSSALSI